MHARKTWQSHLPVPGLCSLAPLPQESLAHREVTAEAHLRAHGPKDRSFKMYFFHEKGVCSIQNILGDLRRFRFLFLHVRGPIFEETGQPA